MLSFRDPQSSLEIDSCPECYGLWFDSEELKLFFESADLSARILDEDAASASAPAAPTRAAPASPTDTAERRLCPTCSEPLFLSKLGRTQVDYCLDCRGIWLDRSELEDLVTAFQSGERGNLLIVNQLVEGLGTPTRPNPRAGEFLEALRRYRASVNEENPSSE
jgi:Zn-finger nucleic acid-binding protein